MGRCTGETNMNTETEHVAHLTELVMKLDLTSADGRAGIKALLRKIEEVQPGSIERMAAGLELTRVRRAIAPVH